MKLKIYCAANAALGLFTLCLFATAPCASASTTISAAGATLNPLPGLGVEDALTFLSAANSYTIPNGVPTLENIQTVDFIIGNSSLASGLYPFTINEDFTINGETELITLSGTDDITSAKDTVTINTGPTTFFPSVDATFTPQLSIGMGTSIGLTYPFTLTGDITVGTVGTVPETGSFSATLAMFGTVGLALRGCRRWIV